MKRIKKISLVLAFASLLCSCGDNEEKQALVIYNSSDYIDESLIEEFEDAYNCEVKYYTFDTNETMYNQFNVQPEGTYDLINTSDYMLQKMVREGLVEPLNVEEECPVYAEYASTLIKDKLKLMPVDSDGDGVNDSDLSHYAAGYMWGTLGIIYDPEASDTIQEDVKSWDIFWDEKYEDLISIKNSMRDTFVVGIMHAFKNLKSKENPTSEEKYFLEAVKRAEERSDNNTELVQNIFDLIINEDDYKAILKVVEEELVSLKDNIFGFEVDSGKNDIITGKIKMNLAWSGDAVYSIETAYDEANKVLEYYVPEEGSNVWYDGWALPKGSNRKLACAFIDFLSEPENAARNMEYIGYTSFIACDEVFDLVSDIYGVSEFNLTTNYHGAYKYYDEEEDGDVFVDASIVKYGDKYYTLSYLSNNVYTLIDKETKEVLGLYSDLEDADGIENVTFTGILPTNSEYWEEIDESELDLAEPYDLKFIFNHGESERDYVIYPYADMANRLETQYPSEEIISRCAIMKDFGSINDDVVIMWGQLRAYTNMLPYYIILATFATGVIVFSILGFVKKKKSTRNRRKSIK